MLEHRPRQTPRSAAAPLATKTVKATKNQPVVGMGIGRPGSWGVESTLPEKVGSRLPWHPALAKRCSALAVALGCGTLVAPTDSLEARPLEDT
jgi:hypothetical protein